MPDLTVAQNIFIGREPRSSRLFTSERRAQRAGARADRAPAPAAARPRSSSATSRSPSSRWWRSPRRCPTTPKLLIMDEPTAALNDAEVQVLHDLIRRFVRPDTGVIYISHRMDELQADRRPRSRSSATAATSTRARPRRRRMKEVISLMVGRELSRRGASRSASRADREVVLEVSGLSTKDLLKDVSFELRKGEILGFAGLMGAGRTEVARAVVGADKADAGTIRLRGREIRDPQPGRRGQAPDRLPVRGPQAVRPAARAGRQREHRAQRAGRALPGAGGSSRTRRCAPRPGEYVGHAADQDAVGRPDGQEPLRRQPAEGRHRQVAGQGLRHPDLRRADPRHRRRRQGGDLPAAQRARAGRASRSS